MSIRTERVAGEIAKVLATPLQNIATELNAGFIGVTEVRMSPDLQLARVYLSIFAGKKSSTEVVNYIEKEMAGRLRYIIGKNIRLRYVPQLRFFVDDSLDQARRIDAILEQVRVKGDEGDSDAND